MSRNEQKQELFKTIWDIANDLRGSVDGWEFKQYIYWGSCSTGSYRRIWQNTSTRRKRKRAASHQCQPEPAQQA